MTIEPSQTVSLIRSFLRTLVILQGHLALYGEGNNNVLQTAENLEESLDRIFASQEELLLVVGRHAFKYKQQFVDRKNPQFIKFAHQMFQHGISRVLFQREVSLSDIQMFLQLLSRKPADTWDEGGIELALNRRNVQGLVVRELNDSDFLLDEALGQEIDWSLGQHSALWEQFVLMVLRGLDQDQKDEIETSDISPEELSTQANQALADASTRDQTRFARDASRYFLTLKHENIKLYRNAAIFRLAKFVNDLSPSLREMFLKNTYSLNIPPDMLEHFFSGLSDNVVLEALSDVAQQQGYTPPVVVQLLGKLAENRDLDIDPSLFAAADEKPLKPKRVRELFKPDDFEKYVPAGYRQALTQILQKDHLPSANLQKIPELKQTLEQNMMDDHLGRVLIEILKHKPDPATVQGLNRKLIDSFDHFAETGNIRQVISLYRNCLAEENAREKFSETGHYLSSARFTTKILNAARQADREKLDQLLSFILLSQKAFIQPLLDRLSIESDRTLRMFYMQCLRQIGQPCVAPTVARLDDQRWFVLRNLLLLLREYKDASVLSKVRPLLGHDHPKVYWEALRTCLAFRDGSAVQHLLSLFDSGDPAQKLTAVSLAGSLRHSEVTRKLLEVLKTTPKTSSQAGLRFAAARSVATAAPQEALPVFKELLKSRSLLQTRQHNELKVEVVGLLGGYPRQDVEETLRELTSSKIPAVAMRARQVLTKFKQEGT